jgi:hypothetical protein
VLGNVWVWHGSGAVASERQSALRYARGLSSEVTEFSQGVDDDDEMFWLVLGDEFYADADYWKWRRGSSEIDPRIWEVNPNDSVSARVSRSRDVSQFGSRMSHSLVYSPGQILSISWTVSGNSS